MANDPFNIMKGRAVEFYNRVQSNDPAASTLIVMLLKANETEADLIDHDNVSAMLAAANTEADFTNYVRKEITDAALSAISPDDTNNRFDIDIPDQVWSSAGGATNNTLTKLIVCYSPTGIGAADTAIIPISHHDFAATTTGTDLTAEINAAGFYRAV